MRLSRKLAQRELGGSSNEAELQSVAFYDHVPVHPLNHTKAYRKPLRPLPVLPSTPGSVAPERGAG